MPRGKKSDTGHGHNSGEPLSDEDAEALVTYYQAKVLEGQRKIDALMVDVKSWRDTVNGTFKRMTADLHFTRKEFEAEVIAKMNMTAAEFAFSEKKRARLHRLAGLVQGEQLDLVELINDTVDDQIEAEANGFRAGLRGDDPSPPDYVHGLMVQPWQQGWSRGQEVNGERFIRAQAIIEARQIKTKPVGLTAEHPDDADDADAGGEDAGADFDADTEARRLEESGWVEPPPTDPDAPINLADSRAVRRKRRAAMDASEPAIA